jgi:hypothetical protein
VKGASSTSSSAGAKRPAPELVDPPGGEAAATGDEFEVRGLALLVCLLEHAGRERARRLIAYLVKRYATCPRCGADMGGKA